MRRYVLRRLAQTAVLLFLVSGIVFGVIRLVPGDPASLLMGTEATAEGLARLRQEMGLDRPIPVQYALWLHDVARGNFGISWQSKHPALVLIQRRVPATLLLTTCAVLVGVAIAAPLGILGGSRPGSVSDGVATTFSLVGVALPSFWLGVMLLLTFAVWLRWLPPAGYVPLTEDPVESLRHVTLPAITLGLGLAAPLARFIRSGMVDVMGQDYIRTAVARGSASAPSSFATPSGTRSSRS